MPNNDMTPDEILETVIDKYTDALNRISLDTSNADDFDTRYKSIKAETIRAIHDSYDWRVGQKAVEAFAAELMKCANRGEYLEEPGRHLDLVDVAAIDAHLATYLNKSLPSSEGEVTSGLASCPICNGTGKVREE